MVKEFFDEYETREYAEKYYERLAWLRELFKGYPTATSRVQAWLREILELHGKLCFTEESQRRHNTFILIYVAGMTAREVGRMQAVSESMAWRYVKRVLEDMMLLVFGVEGLKPPERYEVPGIGEITG